jgi:hypothetical protein
LYISVELPDIRSQQGTLSSAPLQTQNASQLADAPSQKLAADVLAHVIALFDFVVSDAEELGFRKGDLIVILEAAYKDWWKGSLKGQVGILPSNYVQPLLPGTFTPRAKRVRAFRSYQARRNTKELSFEKGDIIVDLGPVYYKVWHRGFLRKGHPGTGQTGVFHLNWVEEYEDDPEEQKPSLFNPLGNSNKAAKDLSFPNALRKSYARFGVSSFMWPIPLECEKWIPGPTGPRPPP